MPSHAVDGTFTADIGGVRFRMALDAPMTFPDPSGSYSEFLSADLHMGPDVAVSVQLSECPDVDKMSTVFDADGAWSLKKRDGGRCFVGHGPSGLKGAPWMLHFDGKGQVTVHGNTGITDADGVVVCPMMYPVDQLLCINILAGIEGMLIHCAGLRVDGKVYLFAGKSGAGKSTLSDCVSGHETIDVLSDDRMIVRRIDGELVAFGTPWPGDAGFARNESAPLGGVFFLEHSDEDAVKAVPPREAAERLMAVTSVPWYDPELSGKVMAAIGSLAESAKCMRLDFRPDKGVADFLVSEIGAL